MLKAIILAGGVGTRLRPYTTVLPKPLMPIAEMPILDIVIRQLKKAGVKQIILSTGYLGELIEAYCGTGKKYNIDLVYVRERKPLGTAGPISLVEGLSETFLVMNGDILTDLDFSKILNFHKKMKGFFTLAVRERKVQINYGVVNSKDGRKVTSFIEKPTLNYQIGMGICVMEPGVLSFISKNKKMDIPDLINILIKKNKKVLQYSTKCYWKDIGISDDYEQAVSEFPEIKKRIFS